MSTIALSGNLGRDAEVKNINGTDVANFTVGHTIGWGDKKRTEWVKCALWGKRATSLAPYLTKGSQVTVYGSFDGTEAWLKDGQPQSGLRIRVNEIALQSKSGGGGEGMGDGYQEPDLSNNGPDLDDEVPFVTRWGMF